MRPKLIASCKACSVEPWSWLQSILTDIPRNAALEALLPDQWLQTNPQHRWNIADHRKEERGRKGNL